MNSIAQPTPCQIILSTVHPEEATQNKIDAIARITLAEQASLEAFANHDLFECKNKFLTEDLIKEVLPLFLNDRDLFALSYASKAWEKVLETYYKKILESWKCSNILSCMIDERPAETLVERTHSIFFEAVEQAKKLEEEALKEQIEKVTFQTLPALVLRVEDENFHRVFCSLPLPGPLINPGTEFTKKVKKIRNWINIKSNLVLEELEIRRVFLKLTILPKEIGMFKNLKKLTLFCNKLTKLPKEISELKNLENVDLSQNLLTELPKEISNLQKLQVFDLSHNQIKKLPGEIGELKSLEKLILTGNQLFELPKGMVKLKNLQGIYLYENPIRWLPREIKELPNLKTIRLEVDACSIL